MATGRLLAVTSEDTVVVRSGVLSAEFQYLLVGGETSEWLRGWRSPATAPIAIRLILVQPGQADTLVLVVGSRA